ncbi:polymorphic toxin-type HINT domain-containing protein [Paenibacillus curdlanolyticus]|nr:polymorphic toxin-type HINT domain-containing protein [Paenibacillus curdlanolyticus]
MSWWQVDDLAKGILSSLGDISGLFSFKTLDALWKTGKAIAKGKISFKDIARSFISSVTGPFMYLYNNSRYVWKGDPSNREVKEYGNQLGTALQMVVGNGGAMKAVLRVIPKLEKLLSKIKPKKSSSNSSNNHRSKGCNCFTAGTLILTDNGDKPIEEIKIGDKVLSRNENTGEEAYKPVIRLFEREAYEIYNIHVGDQVIEATGNHPFWVQGEKWVLAAELEVGDSLLQTGGRTLKIDSITIEKRQETVYNFEVAEFHTYFVSGLGVWVHNETCPRPGSYT